MIGVVKTIIADKNFGFIAQKDNPRDLFFIDEKIVGGLIKVGDIVEYEVYESQRPGSYNAKVIYHHQETERKDEDTLPYRITLTEIDHNLINHLANNPDIVYDLSPRKFEELIAELLDDMGYKVTLTPETKDGGRDVLAVVRLPNNQQILTIVECKKNSPSNKVGISIVERFMYVLENKDRANKGIIVTTSFFSNEALKIEREYKWRLSLYDNNDLNKWLSNYGKWKQNDKIDLWLPDAEQRQEPLL